MNDIDKRTPEEMADMLAERVALWRMGGYMYETHILKIAEIDAIVALLRNHVEADHIVALADADHECEGCLNDQACELGTALDNYLRTERRT